MSSIWTVSKALGVPLDSTIKSVPDVPYTISYVIRKRQQIDNFYEIEEAKRPPEKMIWEGSVEDIERWMDRVFKMKSKPVETDIIFDDIEIEE